MLCADQTLFTRLPGESTEVDPSQEALMVFCFKSRTQRVRGWGGKFGNWVTRGLEKTQIIARKRKKEQKNKAGGKWPLVEDDALWLTCKGT